MNRVSSSHHSPVKKAFRDFSTRNVYYFDDLPDFRNNKPFHFRARRPVIGFLFFDRLSCDGPFVSIRNCEWAQHALSQGLRALRMDDINDTCQLRK